MGRFKVIRGVWMFIDSHLHISSGFPDVINTARTGLFVDHMWSVNVFVFKVKKTFDLFCLPEDDENVLETRVIV